MLIKKHIANFLIILAGLALQAHMVLPHHSEVELCGVISHVSYGEDGGCDCDSNSHSHPPHHDCSHCGSDDDCALKKVIVKQQDKFKDLLHLLTLDFDFHHFFVYAVNVELKTLNEYTLLSKRDIHESYYTSYVIPIRGLRAPPHFSFLS